MERSKKKSPKETRWKKSQRKKTVYITTNKQNRQTDKETNKKQARKNRKKSEKENEKKTTKPDQKQKNPPVF